MQYIESSMVHFERRRDRWLRRCTGGPVKNGWTTIYRSVAQDDRLTLKARGLFLLMQSLPEDWTYTISGLASKAGTGKDQIRAALKELEKVGYLIKDQAHDPSGKFTGNVFILQDEAPLSENPTTVGEAEAPLSGKPSTGKTVNGKSDGTKYRYT